MQMTYHLETVVQTMFLAVPVFLLSNRCLVLPVVIGLEGGGVDYLGPYQQLGRKLLVFSIANAWCEFQLASDGLTEEFSPNGSQKIVVAQIVSTTCLYDVFWGNVRVRGILCEVKHNDLCIRMVPDKVQAAFVRLPDEIVVTVNELNELSVSHAKGIVAGNADTLVLLTDI